MGTAELNPGDGRTGGVSPLLAHDAVGAGSQQGADAPRSPAHCRANDPAWVRVLLTGAALTIMTVLVVIPVVNVFYEALADGFAAYWRYLTADPDTRHAVLVTLTVAPLAVLFNLVFGVAAAWAISRFQFPGRTLLVTLIDIPFAVSPVVAGLMFVLLFGMQGFLGPWLRANGFQVLFTIPGL